jgi:xylono-1,5-lactonase
MPPRIAAELDVRHVAGKGLLEGPRYVPGVGLVFADARLGGVQALSDTGELTTVWPHRRGIGGIAPHAAGGYVVTGRNLAYKRGNAPTVVLHDQDPAVGVVGFNDLTVDAAGRIYIGSLAEVGIDGRSEQGTRRPGSLFLVDVDGSARVVAEDIMLANGVGLAPDGSRLYLSDSARRVIFTWQVDGADGTLTGRRVLAAFDTGLPDGLAVSADGDLWIAAARAGQVRRLSPDGTEVAVIDLPQPLVTSLVFGGPDRHTLYIVTGADGPDDPCDATIFAVVVDVPGAPLPAARTPTETLAGTCSHGNGPDQ